MMFLGESISVTERTVLSVWNSFTTPPPREISSPMETCESMDSEEVKTLTPHDTRSSVEGGPWIQNPDVLFAVTIPDGRSLILCVGVGVFFRRKEVLSEYIRGITSSCKYLGHPGFFDFVKARGKQVLEWQ